MSASNQHERSLLTAEAAVISAHHTAGPGDLPNVLVIGAMKCGSTSLHHYLDAHPDIAMSEKKELNFFYRPGVWNKGLEWYRSQFDPGAPLRGESSVNYTKSPRASGLAAPRMHRLVPHAKLIYMVRHPIERAVSHYLHTRAEGNEERPLPQALSDLTGPYVSRSVYYANVEPFLRHFPAESLLVVPQERLRSQRAATLRAIFSFLGVDADIDRPEFSVMWQTAAEKLDTPGDAAESPTRRESEAIDPFLRERLVEHFRPDFKRVRKLMSTEFRRGWRL
jgi:sulfotransferase family protein